MNNLPYPTPGVFQTMLVLALALLLSLLVPVLVLPVQNGFRGAHGRL